MIATFQNHKVEISELEDCVYRVTLYTDGDQIAAFESESYALPHIFLYNILDTVKEWGAIHAACLEELLEVLERQIAE